MKWRSKDGKQVLDLSKVAYWKYVSKEDNVALNKQYKDLTQRDPGAFFPHFDEVSSIEIYFGGDGPLTFKGDDANEIYTALTKVDETKEIL